MNRWRDPFGDSRIPEMERMVNPLRNLRVQMELARDPFKDCRVQMAETERMVNPLRELRPQENYMNEIRRVEDDSRRFRVELERAVNPIRDFHVQMDEMKRLRDPFKDCRVQMAETERMVNPLRELHTQMNYMDEMRRVVDDSRRLRVELERATDPLREFRTQKVQFDKSVVNFTRILDEIVKPIIPFISTRSVGIDVCIEPEYPEIGEQPARIHCPDNPARSFGEKVFIVCGRDEEAKQTVARRVEKLGLEVVIIDEQPSGALTRIEKFERYADDVTFTVVLLTPDDVGKPKDELGEPNFRASQDVILQLGLLIGKYGRDQICFLYKGELELPSSMNGVNLIPIDTNGGWILNLIREMQFAGLLLDMSKAI